MKISDFLKDCEFSAYTAEENLIDSFGCKNFENFGSDYNEEFLICVHKGRIERVPYFVFATSIGCSKIVYSDEVYIVFHVNRNNIRDDGEKSYYLYMMTRFSTLHGYVEIVCEDFACKF